MTEQAFQDAYERLNPEQRDAVDTIEGPVMVIAGPGTGKTQILTLRIANILKKTDTQPENILALTFTESGARAMRERLHSYIGSAAYRVHIHTFHEFAGNLIRLYPDAYDRAVGGRPGTELEKVRIIESCIETTGIRHLRPHGNPVYYVRPVLQAISLMKREYITPEKFEALIIEQARVLDEMPKIHEKGAHKGKVRSEYQKYEKDILKNRELLFLYRAYDARLQELHLYDFEDMIFETVMALESHEDMLRDLQERFLYILADEHQDVNGSQNRILELLASFHDRPNLFVVGDEKQSIYRFQGASLDNFLYFEEQFPYTKTIALTTNYRSTQNILEYAHTLITAVDSPAIELRVPLTASTSEVGTIERRTWSHESIEDEGVVQQIMDLLKKGTSPDHIAVIVRSNREVELFVELLRARGVPVSGTSDGDILQHPITRGVTDLIRAVVASHDESALARVVHGAYWGISDRDLYTVFRAQSYTRPLSYLFGHDEELESLPLINADAVKNVHRVLSRARDEMVTTPPHRILAEILQASGFLTHIMGTDPFEGGKVVRRLYDEVEALVRGKEIATLEDVLTLFEEVQEYGIPLTAPFIDTHTHAVQVMTAHKSKGLEFDHVFIPHLTETRWGDTPRSPHFRIPVTRTVDADAFDILDDERKLLYVGFTRARRGLYLSLSLQNGANRPALLSPLIADLETELVTEVPVDALESEFNPLSRITTSSGKVQLDTTILTTALIERGLSATSLNNYLRSPWNYLYRNVLRIPEVQSESLLFGTALHSVVCKATRMHAKEGVLPSPSAIKQYLEVELDRMPLSVHEYTRLHKRGFEALIHYFDAVQSRIPRTTREEEHFEALFPTGVEACPTVRLTGNLDRLDFDEEGNLLRVVDYKSGKPKTRGQIEGTTKDSQGDYKRQLTFYMLLLSLQSDTRLHAREGVLSFLEADDSGKIHEEMFVISDEDIETLKHEIVRVVGEITRGAFLTEPCDPEKSDYCDLVELLKR